MYGIFSEQSEDEKQVKPKNKKEMFFDMLPETFTNKEFSDLAKSLSITFSSANRYIAGFCEKGLIRRDQKGIYTNLSLTDLKDSKESD